MLPKPQAVIFDWDNTLVDSWPTIHEALNKTLSDYGKQLWTMEETQLRVHRSLRDSFPTIFAEEWEAAGERYLTHFLAIHLDKLMPLPNAQDTLKQLQDRAIDTYLVSNKTGCNLRKEVAHIKWDSYFTAIVGAKDAKKDKPAVDPVHLALEGSDTVIDKSLWFIGDSITDIECAHNLGCSAIFFGDNYRQKQLIDNTFTFDEQVVDHTVLQQLLRGYL